MVTLAQLKPQDVGTIVMGAVPKDDVDVYSAMLSSFLLITEILSDYGIVYARLLPLDDDGEVPPWWNEIRTLDEIGQRVREGRKD